MTERAWWVESRRNSESEFETPKTKAGFFATINQSEAFDRAHAAELNGILGWQKYRVVTA